MERHDREVPELLDAEPIRFDAPNQDPDEYLTEVDQLHDEFQYIGENVPEPRIMNIFLEGLTKDYGQIQCFRRDRPRHVLERRQDYNATHVY